MIDALRRDHLGLYGYSRSTSPFIDRLGSTGLVFDNAYAQASQTFNSTASLFTSRVFPLQISPRRITPDYSLYSIAEENLTLAEVLHAHGYETFGVFTNPHHYGDSGFLQGFEDSLHLEYVRDPARRTGDARGVVDALIDWLRDRTNERPFFA
jgi:arylsulfatase A-like enzyme